MVMHKRIAWLILIVIAAASASLIIATRQGRGEASVQDPERIRIKVLRRKDRLHLKPTAQEIHDDQPPPPERSFENLIPDHVPIKIKIKKEKEKAFKDLKNDKWARDFAIELTNTGAKPIYSIYMLLVLPEVKNRSGVKIVFPLFYGRNELGDTRTKALPEDVPIRPGETHVFTISPLQIPVWEQLQREEKRPQPKRVQLKLQVISFGDGTGYVGNDGLAVPHAISQTSGVGACPDTANKSPLGTEALRAALKWQKSSSTDSPASFLPVNFYSHSVSLEPKPAPQSCCTADGCTTLTSSPHTNVCVNCPPQERPGISNCGDPNAGCSHAEEGSMECFIRNGEPFTCQTWDLIPCAVGPTPSPTPTPTSTATPTPTPIPTPQDCNLSDRPNDTNCSCVNFPGFGPLWNCGCAAGNAADYTVFPQSGGCDPTKSSNNGNNCCVCTNQITCDSGSHWNIYNCQCDPNELATPTPDSGGGTYVYGECTQWYWVLYECYPVGNYSWNCVEVTRWPAFCS